MPGKLRLSSWYNFFILVFDTSIEEVAREEGIHNPARSYEPLGFTLGGEGMIKGFDSAVQGMAVGEEKTVQLSPEQAGFQPPMAGR
ncbi:MAG: peptidylprolyl isomerase FKBP-type [Methanohalophilus sp.]|nr:MAG: peptidylprolyl isomerase FKBP-type [Methanohalophilus sp.]